MLIPPSREYSFPAGRFGNNTSFLHNCYFVPHVASPAYWVPVDVVSLRQRLSCG